MTIKQHEDTTMKFIVDLFLDDAVQFFGIDEKIVSAERTELVHVDLKKNIDDLIFLTERDTYLHIEFQSTYKKDDIARFMVSDAILYRKKGKPIKTVVVYSSDITHTESTLDTGSIHYSVDSFYMAVMDGEEKINYVRQKLNQGVKLSKHDLITIVLYPLMKSEISRVDRVMQSIDISNKLHTEKEQLQIQAMLNILADKLISDPAMLKKVKELTSMTRISQMIYEDAIFDVLQNALEANLDKEVISKVLKCSLEEVDDLIKQLEERQQEKTPDK